MSDTIRSIGAQMATMMYNLSQGANLPAGTRDLMRDMHQRWDAAVSADKAPPPQPHVVGSNAADAYVAEQGIEHSGGLIERAFEAGATWALPQISDEAIGTIWTAAMTAAVNILVKRQNDLNDDDGPLPVLNEQGDCINALKKWMHVDEVYLYELRHMLGATNEPCDCCESIRRAESDLAGFEDDHQERVDQFAVIGADWAEPDYATPYAPPPTENVVGYQDRVAAAHDALFHDDPTDVAERVARFLEEAMEAAQAFGMTLDDVRMQADYTFNRPAGEPAKEIGAALLTLTSLCVVAGYDVMACGEADLEKLQRPETIARIRAKRATRHGRGPLPGFDPSASAEVEG